jgi:hypothetical protein
MRKNQNVCPVTNGYRAIKKLAKKFSTSIPTSRHKEFWFKRSVNCLFRVGRLIEYGNRSKKDDNSAKQVEN